MKILSLYKKKPNAAAKEWLKRNPGVLTQWLVGAMTLDGKDALPAIKSYLAAQ
jgi:glycine betaine/proline transport system substrate-binding protein